MKKLLAIILVITLALTAAACGGRDEGSVYWLNFKPEADEALQELAKMYTNETGVKVKVVTAASGTYSETLTAEMDKSDAPTLFVVGSSAAVDTWGEYCLYLKDTEIAKQLSTDEYMLYDDAGKLCSIGYCYECYGIIVNKALLAKAGYRADGIKNFAALKAVAEDIHARAAELGFDAFTSAGMDDSSSWRFTGHLINLAYYYESADDPDAWKTCPAALTGKYMDNYRSLWDLMIRNCSVDPSQLASGGFDANSEFATGKAVFYSQGSWEWPSLQEKGMQAEDLAMLPYYCGVQGEENAGLNCGTENYWAVNSTVSQADIDATLEFMKWLVTDGEASAKAVAAFGIMPYKNAAASQNPFLAIANEYAANGHYNMWWATNYQPNPDAYRAAAVSAMNAYNAHPTDANWDAVVTAYIEGWATQYKAVYG